MPHGPPPNGSPDQAEPQFAASLLQDVDRRVGRALPEFKRRLLLMHEASSARTGGFPNHDLGEAWVKATLWMAEWKFGLSHARVVAIVKEFFGDRPPVLAQEYQGVVRSLGDEAITIEFDTGDDLETRRIRRQDLRSDEPIQVGDVVHVTTTMSVAPIGEYQPTREELEQLKRAVAKEQALRDRHGAEDE